MNLSSTSWLHHSNDDSYTVEDLHYPLRTPPVAHITPTSFTGSNTNAMTTRKGSRTPLHTRSTYEARLTGVARFVKGRRSRDVLADLQRIRGEANALLLRRLLLRWGLYALRQGALWQLQDRTRQMLWRRLGGRCFAWWRLVTERRLCRETLYQEAAVREASYLRDVVCRGAWQRWRRWALWRSRRRDRATRLSLVNRQRHALSRLHAWVRYPRLCSLVQQLQGIRFTAERRLARFTLVAWRLHTVERLLLAPLQAHAAQQVARWAFGVWRRGAVVMTGLHRLQRQVAFALGVRALQRWKRWLRRRIQAALLLRANEARHLLLRFTEWAWRHQLDSLDYER